MNFSYLFQGKQRIDGYFMRGNQKNIKTHQITIVHFSIYFKENETKGC